MYEVCIVAAGIADSTLAYNLGPSLKTCVIEKAEKSLAGTWHTLGGLMAELSPSPSD
jgi:aspartate oxidase